jgi:hypothetical protein
VLDGVVLSQKLINGRVGHPFLRVVYR